MIYRDLIKIVKFTIENMHSEAAGLYKFDTILKVAVKPKIASTDNEFKHYKKPTKLGQVSITPSWSQT